MKLSKGQLVAMSQSLATAKDMESKEFRNLLIDIVKNTLDDAIDKMDDNKAVVLPEPIGLEPCAPISLEWMAERKGYREGWNNAIAETKKLNIDKIS